MNLQLVSDWISNHLLVMSGSVAIFLELILRMVPSEKPIGIMQLVSEGCKQLSDIFSKVHQFLDKVLPQKLK